LFLLGVTVFEVGLRGATGGGDESDALVASLEGGWKPEIEREQRGIGQRRQAKPARYVANFLHVGRLLR
jgi:hypothetical protein